LIELANADVGVRTPGEEWTPLHLAAMQGNAEALEVLAPRASSEVLLALDVDNRSARDLAEEAGHQDATQVLKDPEEAHQRLVCKWSKMLDTAGPEVKLSDLLSAALGIEAPELERIGKDAVELSWHITDLEYRVTGYVVEVRRVDGPEGAAPSRVYYARAPEQRKLERVQFLVPRLRTNGLPVWEQSGTFQFRLTGCCDRANQLPRAVRQVSSGWSAPACLVRPRTKQRGRAASLSDAAAVRKRALAAQRRPQSRPRWPPSAIISN